MRVIDSHVHFWRIGGAGQSWPDAEWPLINRDFGPAELLAAIAAAAGALDVQGVVLVQSQPDGRLMWGSDWPVLRHARDSYSDWLACARQYAGVQDQAQLESLFSGAAREFYRLE